jgi:hypothetical protein
MEVVIFGKVACGKCKGAQSRARFVVENLGLTDAVPVRFVDLDSIDGRAEGAFHDVYDAVPVTIIKRNGEDVGRWEGEMPKTTELGRCFEGAASATAD